MGYFNYFIKCIIRNIAYKLCKPKVFLTVLFSIIILFVLHSYGYCSDWTDSDIEALLDSIATITANQGVIVSQLSSMGVDVTDIENKINEVANMLYYIRLDTSQLIANTSALNTKIDSLITETQKVSDMLWYIRLDTSGIREDLNTNHEELLSLLESNNTLILNELNSIKNVIHDHLANLNSKLEQGNQLQEQNNQMQQEQNNFLKQEQSDSDVSVDSFNSVDSNDVTSAGLTGVFTNIYNSITNWSSKDINLPIPYTNKNITIPANYTQNMLSSFGGSWIITFISSIYYFIVARFIIYSITGIVNSIKSGSILETDSKNNITTDML